jgi:NAD(P)-dependent dehydrogenase (short-subunit alcohol dehydrogenase family)
MRVDHFGTFLALRFSIPEMIKNGRGSVINMVSVAGFGNSTGGRSAYASSKAAAMNLTRTTAHAFAKDRIRINAVAPAAVGSERIKKMLEAQGALLLGVSVYSSRHIAACCGLSSVGRVSHDHRPCTPRGCRVVRRLSG